MFRYLEFLLEEFSVKSKVSNSVKNLIYNKPEVSKLIINCIYETELSSFLSDIVDYKVESYSSINTDVTVLDIDKIVKNNLSFVSTTALRIVANTHFNPIWRISAFFCEYLIKTDELYKS